MHFDLTSLLIPLLFWGGLYFAPFSRSVKVIIAVVVVLLGFVGYASAQALPVSPHPVTVSGNVTTFGPATANAANAASFTFGHAANGPVYAQSQGVVRTASGNAVPVVVRSLPAAAGVGRALIGLAKFATGIGTVLAVGNALYDVAKELGFNLDNSSGSLVLSSTQLTPPSSSFYRPDLCAQYGGGACVITPYNTNNNSRTVGPFDQWVMWYPDLQTAWTSIPYSPPASVPATAQELEDAIASRTAWPSTSRINDALRDAVAAGQPLELPKPSTITGPAEIVNPPKTETHPDGSKTVTTTKDKLTYNSDGVEVEEETVVETFDALNNPTGTSTTTEASPAPKPDPVTCGLPGTPACKLDETGTPEADPLTESATKPGMDGAKAEFDDALTRVTGDSDKGWAWTFLAAPPIAACESLPLPSVMGIEVPNLNPCTTVDGMRAVMAWLWAFAGFYACIGFVREVI